MDDVRTMIREHRHYPEYSEFFSTGRVDETGRFGDRPQRESTQVRWFGQDVSRELDSCIGYTQDHQTRWPDNGWVEPDSFAPTNSQPTGRKRRAGGRSAVRRIPDGAVHWKENQWGIPHKRALFTSDGPDSTSSGSDVVEGHNVGPSDEGYPGVDQSGLLQEVDSQKGRYSPSRQLEAAVVRLQQDIADYRTELRLNRQSLLCLRNGRDLRRRQFPDSQGGLAGSNICRCLRPLFLRMDGMMSWQLCSCFLTWIGMPST